MLYINVIYSPCLRFLKNRLLKEIKLQMIPKIIHYVWVGNQPKPDLVTKCIASWKSRLPDYQIKEWGNKDLTKIDNLYVKEAFKAQKWAFVSDYLRLYALYHHGGIYLDTDIIITQLITEFLENDFFIGSEPYKKNQAYPMTAVIGASYNNKIILGLLNSYQDDTFIKSNGEFDLTTNPMRFADFFLDTFNLKYPYNKEVLIELDKNSKIYPSHYFCTPEKNKKNYAIHLFNGSWLDDFSRKDLYKFKSYKLVKFKKNNENGIIPLKKNEIIVTKLKLSSKKFFALTKTKK